MYTLISFKLNYMPYQIKKNALINKIYLYVHTNLIIYVIVNDFFNYLIYILLYHNM